MLTLRGAGGLGDAVYMYPVLKYYMDQGNKVEILTKFHGVYECLKEIGCRITDRYLRVPDRECRYAPRYSNPNTTTYEDTLIMSGIENYIPLEIQFKSQKVFEFKTNKKICVIRIPVIPMKGRGDESCLIPNLKYYQSIIDAHKNELYFVLAGNRNSLKSNFEGIDLDLTNTLDIPGLFQLISQSDICLCQSCFMLPFAESINKKCFVIFAADGMKSPFKFYRYITPEKIINKPEIVNYCIDNESESSVIKRFGDLLGRKSE